MYRLERSAGEVYRFVARRVANVADAEDIAQQTMLVAWAKFSSFRGENLSGWLFTIARHLVVDYYRARNRFQFVEVGPETLGETEPTLQSAPDAVRVAYECRERLKDWLFCVTERLDLEAQIAVLLADICGYRDKDSAAILRMSLPSFKLLLHRARARLRKIDGDNHLTVRKTNDARCGESDARHGKNVNRANGGQPSARRSRRVARSCRLTTPQLLALRRKLLDGLTL
jgi:RNA polymerase sigma-70 factor (ECF subfamily)